MVVTGSCLRMSKSETGCAESQRVDGKTRIHRSLQTSCHLSNRLPEEIPVADRQNNMENQNLLEVDQEIPTHVIGETMTMPVYESVPAAAHRLDGHYFGTKGDMVFSLLSVLGTHNKEDMSRTLLAMSTSFESCVAMRQSGCLPLLIHLLHGSENDAGNIAIRSQAAAALHNIVHVHCEDQRGRQEARVLRLLEQIRGYCDNLRLPNNHQTVDHLANSHYSGPSDYYPGPAVAALMKLSFDEEHRHAVCTLGGVQAIAELLQMDQEVNGSTTSQYHVTMRRYACMALTNLTFGDGTNKALLCSMVPALKALVMQLESSNEDLCQVAASVLRNLSWHADFASKRILRDIGAVPRLMHAALVAKKESTLKSLLSALWNFSSHCIENKADICATDGALQFLVKNLTYRSPLKTLSIIENCGGILRNVSSHIAIHEDYRSILRQHGCHQILLKHLRSPSLTVVSNACGTLWNLSARCVEDQKILLELGAVNMLKNLVHSKHKMISMGSAAALKNLLSAMPALQSDNSVDPALTMSVSKSDFPGLHMRRQRALESELEQQNLSETCDNMESPQVSPSDSPKMEIHAKPKNNPPVIELLTGSASRATSSLHSHLPTDDDHVFHTMVDGMSDRRRGNKIFHANNFLHDRQSPVVCDSVIMDAKEMKKFSSNGIDLMYGSHSQLQDVKMMHSFSSYCEPTASTSPESSPTGRNMIPDSTKRLFPSYSDYHPLESKFTNEVGLGRSDAQVSEESCSRFCMKQTAKPIFDLISEEDSCKPVDNDINDESNSAFGKVDYTQNRLSIACSENLFSFDSDNSEIHDSPPDKSSSFNKGASSGKMEYVSADIKDNQGIVPVLDIQKSNFQENEKLNLSFTAQKVKSETVECSDNQPLVILRRNCASASKFTRKDEEQVDFGNRYEEKCLQQNSDNKSVENDEFPVSPSSLSYNDTFELKVSVDHDFRRLSSAGSHGDDSQDDDDSVQDDDDIVIEELPLDLNVAANVNDEVIDRRMVEPETCLQLWHDAKTLDGFQMMNNDSIVSPGKGRSSDLMDIIPPVAFRDDNSFCLKSEDLCSTIKTQNAECTTVFASEISTASGIPAFCLVDDKINTDYLFKGNRSFSNDLLKEAEITNYDASTDYRGYLDKSLRTEISQFECADDCVEDMKDFVFVNSFEEENKCAVGVVVTPLEDDSHDHIIAGVDGCNVIESFRSTSDSVIDIMNESFPDLSSSLISELATSHEDFLTSESTKPNWPFNLASDVPNFNTFEVPLISKTSTEAERSRNVREPDEESRIFDLDDSPSLDSDQISLEQELLLEENANIILSLLETTTMLGSVASESHLLELETLSLVSNDEEDLVDHDDMSEASYSLSVTSMSQSEPSSERYEIAPQPTTRPTGPRILKPVAKESQNQQEPEKDSGNGPKSVRGRRKLLYNTGTNKQPSTAVNKAKPVNTAGNVAKGNVAKGKVSTVSGTQCKPVEKPNIVKPVRPVGTTVMAAKPNPNPKPNTKVTNTSENGKKSTVRANRSANPSSSFSVGQTKPRAPSLPSERKPLPPSRQVRSAPVRSKTVSERTEVGKDAVKKTSAKPVGSFAEKCHVEYENIVDSTSSAVIDQEENLDRPKPPIKQDTFVKEAPSFSVVVVEGKKGEVPFRKEKENEGNEVSRVLTESRGSLSAQPLRRTTQTRSGTPGTIQGRQSKSDVLTGRKNLVSESQIGRSQTSYSVPSTARNAVKAGLDSTGNSFKTSTFTKKSAAVANVSPAGSICSISSAGKTSRSSSGYTDRTRPRASNERLSSASPRQKTISSEKPSHELLQRKTTPSVQPTTTKTMKPVQVVQQGNSTRGRVRQLKQPIKQADVIGRACAVSTLTRSSTYDKLTEDDPNTNAEQPNDLTLDVHIAKYNISKDKEVKPNDVDLRRLTHVVDSDFNFEQSFSAMDDETPAHDDSERITKSQDCAELTLSLDAEFSITDPLYCGRSLTLDRSAMMSSNIFERFETPKLTDTLLEDEIQNISRPARTSSTLPRSLFSTQQVFTASITPRKLGQQMSAKAIPSDDFAAEDSPNLSSKSSRCKEGRKLGFGLWRRNNVSAKGKPESEEKQETTVQHKAESKAGSPVHKVFGWFRRAGEGGRKGVTSKIPGPESGRSNDSGSLDNSRTRPSDVNSNQTPRSEASHRGTDRIIERQVGITRSNSPLKAAIVQPFNYRPVAKVGTVANEIKNESSQEPMTKTEMLLARRRQSRAINGLRESINSDDNLKLGVSDKLRKLPSTPSGKSPKSGFLVTSV